MGPHISRAGGQAPQPPLNQGTTAPSAPPARARADAARPERLAARGNGPEPGFRPAPRTASPSAPPGPPAPLSGLPAEIFDDIFMRLPCAGEVALAMVNKALHQAAALPLEATRLATGAARVSTLAQFKALLDQPAATAGQERKGTILALPGHLQAGPLTVLSSQLWRLAPVERNEANHLAQRAIERLPPAHQAEPLAALEIALRCGRLDNVAARASTLAQFKALLGQQGSAPGRNCIPGLPGHLRALPLVHLSERIRQLPRDDRHAAYQLVQGAVKQLSPAHQADPLAALLGQIDVLPRGDQRLQEFADGQEAIDALPPEFRAAPLGALLANWVSVLPRSRIHEWGVSWGRKAIGQLPPADREPHLAILDSHAPPF